MAHTHDGATGPRPAGRPTESPASSAAASSAPSAAVLTPPTGLPAVPATPSVPQQRTPADPVLSVTPRPPARPDLRLCSCGHPEEMHEHYRAGTDCGACGARSCRAFRLDAASASASDSDGAPGPVRRLLHRWTP